MSPSRRLLWLAGGLLAPLLLWRGLRWFERLNVYHPSRVFSILPQTYGLAHEELTLKTEDGLVLHGWYLPAEAGPLASKRLNVLFFHGNAGNISDRMDKVHILHKLGLAVLVFDYRGYGKSEGSPGEAGTYRDGEAAWRWLSGTKRISADRIVFYGESLGNGVALETALHHAPAALVMESPFTSIPDMGREVFPWLPIRAMTVIRYDNLAKLPKIRAPLLLLQSRSDEIVPFWMGKKLFEAARGPKTFFELIGGHNDGYAESGPAYPAALRDFLSRL